MLFVQMLCCSLFTTWNYGLCLVKDYLPRRKFFYCAICVCLFLWAVMTHGDNTLYIAVAMAATVPILVCFFLLFARCFRASVYVGWCR